MNPEPIQAALPCHPQDDLLRTDRIPHIWCSGCGIGIVFNSLITAIKKSGLNQDEVAVVSGIGCTGRMAGYIALDSFHTTHGRAIPFATGLKLARPQGQVIVASGDGDLLAIGGNHFIHAARRNLDLTVICVNNFNYGMTGGQLAPSTPFGAKTTTTPLGSPDEPFNFCALAAACGAVYVARWTALHIRRLTTSLVEAIQKKGFSFVEILAPCPTAFGRRNQIRKPVELLRMYHDRSVVRNDLDPNLAVIDFAGNLVVGKFVDRTRTTFLDNYGLVNRREAPDWLGLEHERLREEKARAGAGQ
ncbi:MAG: 2-oxoacid:ferredoxin oxidoreductase subunit beta [Desulfarculus sp.]|nr:2-oxoacid:ferredoxin oxidoreductase subunit beta [Desulfarculus sp.]